jgi:hypothetical protein
MNRLRAAHRWYSVGIAKEPLQETLTGGILRLLFWFDSKEADMDNTTLIIIIVLVLIVFGGGFYGRGRWF